MYVVYEREAGGVSVNAIEVVGLRKSFGKVTALSGLNLSVPRGSVCALLGPNGAGKTTAVRILATLARPDAGTATVAGHDVIRQPEKVRASIGAGRPARGRRRRPHGPGEPRHPRADAAPRTARGEEAGR
jgi:ABC-type uncharacterized transport system ATPase subunit